MKAKNMTKRLFAGLLAAAMVFTSAPMTQAEAAKKKAVTITVTTQAELNAALAKKGVTSIVIKTKNNVTLKLTNAASKAKLVVDAPNARISNSAKLAGITIKDAKAFTEKSVKGNSITVADKKLSLTVAQAAQNVTVRSSAKNADINLKVNGELKKLTVDKKADISIKGSTDQTVTIVNNAKGSAVDVKVESAKMALTQPADVKIAEGTNIAKLMVKTDANIEVAKGATVDKVVVAGKDASVAIQADGAVGKVDVNSKAEVALTGSTDQKVELNVNAKDAAVSTAVKTEVKVNADAEVSIEKGAEGSSVAKADGVETKVSNASDDKIVVTDSNGKESSVEAGKTAISNDEGTKEENKEPEKKPETETPAGGSSSDSGSTSPSGPVNVDLQGIVADDENKSVQVGKSIKLTPVFKPANATNKKVYWSVNNSAVASVDNNGNVIGKTKGDCVVTASSDQGGYKATWSVTVEDAELTNIALSSTNLTMVSGDTVQLTATPVPSFAPLGTVVWGSDNSSVATVENGKVTAGETAGNAVITCTSGSISATCTVTVSAAPTGGNAVKLTFKDGDNILSTKTVESGAALSVVKPDDPTKKGYTFDGWSTKQGGEKIDAINYTANEITLFAKFNAISYKITFPQFEGLSQEVPYGTEVTMPNGDAEEGLEFLGWATSANASSPEQKPGDKITCSGDATYYGVWKRKMISVTASADGGAKFFYGLWKNENNENLIGDISFSEAWSNENYWKQNFVGYASYDNGTNLESVSFMTLENKVITGIKVDNKTLTGEELKTAIQNGYVSVDRKQDHSIHITMTDAGIEFTPGQNISMVQGEKFLYDPNTNFYGDQYIFTVTSSAIKLSDVFTVTATGIINPKVTCRAFVNDQHYEGDTLLSQVITPQTRINKFYVWISGDNCKDTLFGISVNVKPRKINFRLGLLPGVNNVERLDDVFACTASAVTLGAVVTASAIDAETEETYALEFYTGTRPSENQPPAIKNLVNLESTEFNAGSTTTIFVIAKEQGETVTGLQSGKFIFFDLIVKAPVQEENE